MSLLLTHQGLLMAGGTSFDPSAKAAAITLSNANLDAQASAAESYSTVYATKGYNTGRHAFEMTIMSLLASNGHSAVLIGIADKTNVSGTLASYLGNNSGNVESAGYNDSTFAATVSGGRFFKRMTVGDESSTAVNPYDVGDVITVEVNMTTNQATFYKNGASFGVGGRAITASKTYYPAVSLQKSARVRLRTTGLLHLPAGCSEWG